MTFWTYMIQCGDRTFYVGHTNDLEERWGEHRTNAYKGYTSTRHPLHLVWSQEFGTRLEALEAERRLKGWGKEKKLALIRGDWALVSRLSRSRKEGRASTSSARTVFGGGSQSLFLHPHHASFPLEPFSLEVRGSLSTARLQLRYRLTGNLATLRIPLPATPDRRDNLWQHTCFEAFIASDAGYFEINLSPSTQWAAYAFTAYREGMANLDVPAPIIKTSRTDRMLELTAEIELPSEARPERLGVSAVIEEVSGAKSYWALRHPPGDKPDFHHPDCFAIALSPAGQA